MDGQRVLPVTANVVPAIGNANDVRQVLEASVLPGLRSDYPGLSYEFSGRQREERSCRSRSQRPPRPSVMRCSGTTSRS